MLRTVINLLHGRRLAKREEVDYNQAIFTFVEILPSSEIDLCFRSKDYHRVTETREHSKVKPTDALRHLTKHYKPYQDSCRILHEVYTNGRGKEKHYIDISAMIYPELLPIMTSTLEYSVLQNH
ncbi:hypothetical protein HYU11_05370 [Candidatus Woesearchaeota archaeon]|nr:hypothetical protein [Candidatus Woesearchaeota archaeon]